MKVVSAAIGLGAVALVSACIYRDADTPAPRPSYGQPPPPAAQPPMIPAAGVAVSNADAAQSLTEAHCNHEAKCNRIGPAARYSSWEHCLNAVGIQSDSKFRECRYGVRSPQLTTCMSEIVGQGCDFISQPFDAFEQAYACRTAALCAAY